MIHSKQAEPAGKAAQIIEAARAAFLEQGYDAVSMDEVAKRAGVAKQTVYSYYSSKNALFLAVIERERRDLDRVLEAPPITTAATVRDGLRESGMQLIEIVLGPSLRSLFGVIVTATHRFPTLGPMIYEGVELRHVQMAGTIKKAVDAGELRADDPQVAAEQFSALIRGQLFMRCLFDPSFAPSRTQMERQVNEAVDCFLAKYGVAAKQPRPNRTKPARPKSGAA